MGLFCPKVLLTAEDEITVLVLTLVEVVDPCTHLPLERINPSLAEQVLQAIPPSL